MKYINYTVLCFYLFLNAYVAFASPNDYNTQNEDLVFSSSFKTSSLLAQSELTSIYCNVLWLNKILISWNETTVIARLDDFQSSQSYISHASSSPSHLFSVLGVRLQRYIENRLSESEQIFIYMVKNQSRGTLIMGNNYYELYGCTPAFIDSSIE